MKFNIWKECPRIPLTKVLSTIVDNRGKTVPTSSSGHKLIATNCIRNESLYPSYDKIRYLSDETYKTWFRAHPIPGDIIFVCKGTPGRVCLVPDPIDFCIAQDMVALRANSEIIYNKYLLTVLRSFEVQEQISSTSVGDVIPHFKKSFFDQILIPIPDMTIQKGLGDFYYELSQKVELNKKINDNLEQQAETIFHKFFVDSSIAEAWGISTLDSLTTLISRGIAPKYTEDSAQIVINQKCIRDHYIDISLGRKHKPKNVNEKWLQYGDLLINSTGEGTLGRTAQVWFVPENMTVDSHVTIVRPKYQHLIFYIGFWGLSHEREIESLHTGSTGQTELPRERVKSMKLLIPDSETLARFNTVIEPMVSAIISNQQENVRLAKIRDTLLPELMSGEIDVSNIQI